MANERLIENIVETFEGVREIPRRAEVIGVQQHSLDELGKRTRRLLERVGKVFDLQVERRDWDIQESRTVVRMPFGSRLVVFHASGAMRVTSGIEPMEVLFEEVLPRAELIELVKGIGDRLELAEWVGDKEKLDFERLWQIKAQAADKNGNATDPVLCRAVGAYRHFVGELPVLGPASVALKLAAEGKLDSLTVQLREPTSEVIDKAEILRPEQAAKQTVLQLSGLMGETRKPLDEFVTPRSLQFGYLSLGKRQAQRVLAPVYVAALEVAAEEESQAYLLVTSATEKTYLPLSLKGKEAPPSRIRRTA